MISSAALPNVALSSPPTPAPSRSAMRSVAAPMSPASGTIASAAHANVATPPQPSHSAAAATGMNTSSSNSARSGLSRLGREAARRGMATESARAWGARATRGPPGPDAGVAVTVRAPVLAAQGHVDRMRLVHGMAAQVLGDDVHEVGAVQVLEPEGAEHVVDDAGAGADVLVPVDAALRLEAGERELVDQV